MTSTPPFILVVEDQLELRRILQFNLMARGYEVATASDGIEALRAFDENPVDLVLLDLMMPGMDGFEVCHNMRASSHSVGIIVMSALSGRDDQARALEAGADEYLVKPFGIDELLLHVRAVLKRPLERSRFLSEPVTFGGLEFDPASCRILYEGNEEARLTPVECSFLEMLIGNAGKVVAESTILIHVWGPEYVREHHYPQAYIRRLRSRLRDDEKAPRLLFTHPGRGYQFNDDVVRLRDDQ